MPAEELLSDMEATQLLPDLADALPSLSLVLRRAFPALPLDQRRRIMAEQAAQLAPDNAPDHDWQNLNADHIIDNA